MKFSSFILKSSLAVNAALLVASGFLIFASKTAKPVEVGEPETVRKEPVAEVEQEPEMTPVAQQPRPHVPFEWSMVASADLEVYLANLKAIGCPEQTIRDIIMAEVNDLTLKKMAEKFDVVRHGFWTILANWKTREKEVEEQVFNSIETILEEREAMLAKLLGSARDPDERPSRYREKQKDKFDYLPDEKRERMIALAEQYDEEQKKIRNDKSLSPTDLKTAAKELASRTEEQRKALLSSEEYQEYQLRSSSAASVRYRVAFSDLDESEVRKIAKIQFDFEQASTAAGKKPNDPAAPQELEKLLAQGLGEARYAEYKRSTDQQYQAVARLAARYKMPRETAASVYEIQQSATTAAKQLRELKDLSDEERFAALAALQEETTRNVTGILGDKATQTYRKYGGSWLEDAFEE